MKKLIRAWQRWCRKNQINEPDEMIAWERGFYLAGQWWTWGITPQALRAKGVFYQQSSNLLVNHFEGGSFFGLPIESVSLTRRVDASDRPYVGVEYIISHDRSQQPLEAIQRLSEALIQSWGQPDSCSDRQGEKNAEAYWSKNVRLKWIYDGVRVELAWHGHHLRYGERWRLGSLWVTWVDVEAQAQPYLPTLRARQSVLNQMTRVKVLARVFCPSPSDPLGIPRAQEEEYERALDRRDNLLTSPYLTQQVSADEWMLWENEEKSAWGISTTKYTVMVNTGESIDFVWTRAQPSRYPGYEGLRIGSLTSQARPYGGQKDVRDIEAFVTVVKKMPGVNYELSEGRAAD
jgi:hypothetical protein